MACYHPNRAFQTPGGAVKVVGSKGARLPPGSRALLLPCGQCIGCRLETTRTWAIRCVNEASLYNHNIFITLTYDNEHLPHDLSLRHRDFQLFMKRLRKHLGGRKIRYYMCGEYGEGHGRPHYHACIFNYKFPDQLYFKSKGGATLYTSHILDRLWGMGFSLIGAVTFQSAAYIASYCTQKYTGKDAAKHYRLIDKTTGETFDRKPEYTKMSNQPGIGAAWLHKYLSDVYPKGSILVDGRFGKPPRYYDKLFKRDYDTYGILSDHIQQQRMERAKLSAADQTRERRAVREQVALARTQSKRKTLT